jgi:omega-6 fatty acid desaturase (delta-12 desaturase)
MQSYSNEEIVKALRNWQVLLHDYARADKTKALIQMATTFLPFLALWVLMYFSLSWSYWITLGLGILNAFFLVRIFIIQHDCGHKSFFPSQLWNKVVGFTCSFFSTIPYDYWSRQHSFHHGHNGELEVRDIGDIQLMTEDEFRQASRWQRLWYRVYRMPLVTFVIGPLVYLGINMRWPLTRMEGWKGTRLRMYINNLMIAAVYLLVGWLVGWQRFLLVQAPIVIAFFIIAIWFFYVQHQHELAYKQWHRNWDYLLSAIRGSTFYKLPKMVHWLTGNIGYHHIHHLNSKIPSYHLVRCAEENPVLQKYITSITFWESLKCMFHKLWSEEQQRMITFREFYQRERMRRQLESTTSIGNRTAA